MEELVQRIVEYMEGKGHTPATLAKALGMNRPSLIHMLSGRNKPNLLLLMKLAEFDKELDLRDLLTGHPEMSEQVKSAPPPTLAVDSNEKVKKEIVLLKPDGTYSFFTEVEPR